MCLAREAGILILFERVAGYCGYRDNIIYSACDPCDGLSSNSRNISCIHQLVASIALNYQIFVRVSVIQNFEH